MMRRMSVIHQNQVGIRESIPLPVGDGSQWTSGMDFPITPGFQWSTETMYTYYYIVHNKCIKNMPNILYTCTYTLSHFSCRSHLGFQSQIDLPLLENDSCEDGWVDSSILHQNFVVVENLRRCHFHVHCNFFGQHYSETLNLRYFPFSILYKIY